MVCDTFEKLLINGGLPNLMLGAVMVEQPLVTVSDTIGERVVLPTCVFKQIEPMPSSPQIFRLMVRFNVTL